MKRAELKAIDLSNEINLNSISEHFGLNIKFKWDEALFLDSKELKGIIPSPANKIVFLFSFGTGVFINCEFHEITDIVNYLNKIDKGITLKDKKFCDDFVINISDMNEINNDFINITELTDYHYEIVSTVLAKSVSLEKIEKNIDILSDELEELVFLLEKGNLKLKENKIAKIWSRILGFKHNMISYIMLLDKPEITWVNSDAERLFEKMSKNFELNYRYETINKKTQIFSDIIEAFSGLAGSKKSNRLEWIVIILIFLETVFILVETLLKFILK